MNQSNDAILLKMIDRAARYYQSMYPCQTLWTTEEVYERAAFEAAYMRQYVDPSSSWFVYSVLRRMKAAFKKELAERARWSDADLSDVAARPGVPDDDVLVVCERVFKKLEERKRACPQLKSERNRAIVERWAFEGKTMEDVAREFGITRARVSEIVNKFRKQFAIEWEKEQ